MRRIVLKQYQIIHRIDQWFKQHLTDTGMLVLCFMIAAAVFGVDTSKTNTYQLFVFLLVLLIFSMLGSLFNRLTVNLTRELPRYGTVGEPLHYTIHIEKSSPKIYDGLALCERLTTSCPTVKQLEQFYNVARLPWYKRNISFRLWQEYLIYARGGTIPKLNLPTIKHHITINHSFIPLRRGVLHFEPAIIAKPDTLGLFCTLIKTGETQNCIVLPKRYPIKPLNLSGRRKYQAGGISLANSVGNSYEFMGLRDYHQGDSLRSIHWKSYAKLGKLIVKDYQDEYFVRRALVLDTFIGNASNAQFEAAISVAASLASSEHYTEALLDLLFVGEESYCFTVGRSVDQLSHLQEILASVQDGSEHSFKQLSEMVMARMALCSSFVCVLMHWDTQRQNFVQQLLANNMPVAVFLLHDGQLNINDCQNRPSHFYLLDYHHLKEQLATI